VWLFTLALPVVINLATSNPSPWWAWPAFILLGLALTVFEILRFRRKQLGNGDASATLDPRLREDAIRVLRRRLETRLKTSLGGHPEITVRLAPMVKVVAPNPDLVILDPADEPPELPDTADLIDAFELYRESVLVAGEAGAGKTVMAIRLALELLDRAELDERAALPVLVDLGEWVEPTKKVHKENESTKDLTLLGRLIGRIYHIGRRITRRGGEPTKEVHKEDEPATDYEDDLTWLGKLIGRSYHIGRKITRRWIEERRLILLLDGLDELWGDRRNNCVAWINRLQERYAMPPTVVSCRTSAISGLLAPLALRGAVVVEPLTPEQVSSYLGFASDMVDRPLWLRLIRDASEIAGPFNVPANERAVIEAYVKAVLRGGPYPPAKVRAWLSRLANPEMRSAAYVYTVPRRRPWVGLPGELAPELRYPYCLGMMPGLLGGFVGAGVALPLTLHYGLVYGLVAALIAVLPALGLAEICVKQVPAGPMQPGRGWLTGAIAGTFVGLASWALAEGVRAVTGLHWIFPTIVTIGAGAFGALAAIPCVGVVPRKPAVRWRTAVRRMRASVASALLAGALLGLLGLVSSDAVPGHELPAQIAFIGSFTGLVAVIKTAKWAEGLAAYQLGVWLVEVAFGTMPARLDALFRHAVDCGLLVRDGGGYRFLHATVHDYFATAATADPVPTTASARAPE
jgi:hypothetical protein